MSAKHTGSALTGAAVLFVLLRLLAVSHYDRHTAFALLHTLELDDAPGLFLGTFMADDRISTVLLMIVTPATFFFYFRTREDPERASTTTLLALIVLVALMVSHTLTYHRWWLVLGAVAIGVAMVLAIRNARWVLKWSPGSWQEPHSPWPPSSAPRRSPRRRSTTPRRSTCSRPAPAT